MGGLRIDHVMGLFRLFWIPRALGTKGGSYVRTRADELMAIVALESERARAFIIGEDLGTVEPGVRERLHDYRMMSYRLLYFEPAPPEHFPELALSSVTTHDLPTIAGLWTGFDAEAQKKIGIDPNEAGTRSLREKLRTLGHLDEHAPVEAVIESTHRALARAPVARPSGHARRRGRHARAPQPARHRQPVAQLVAGAGEAAGGDRRDGAPRPAGERAQKIGRRPIRDTMGL